MILQLLSRSDYQRAASELLVYLRTGSIQGLFKDITAGIPDHPEPTTVAQQVLTKTLLNDLAVYGHNTLPPGAQDWLSGGDRCPATDTLFTVLTGFPLLRTGNFVDICHATEVVRCKAMLDSVPSLRAALPAVKGLPSWVPVLRIWSDLEAIIASNDVEMHHQIAARINPLST